MESATIITFTTAAKSTVKVVLYARYADSGKANGYNRIDFDPVTSGTFVQSENPNLEESKTYEIVYTDVTAGSHTIKRNSGGETEVGYISVEYTGAIMTQLTAPTITCDAATGTVTLTDTNSSSEGIYYTTDGSEPSETNGTKYVSEFTVKDGTVVKAVAIGSEANNTISSPVAEKLVTLTGIQIAAPVVKSYNGTVAITCANPNATIEYSTDGTTYNSYSRAFTLAEDATVYARASRVGCTTSEVTKQDVKAVPANVNKSRTLIMGYGAFTKSSDGATLTGNVGDDAEGFTLTMPDVTGKSFSGKDKISAAAFSLPERTSILGSNQAKVKLTMPEGVTATRLTLYSYINAASGTRTTSWRELNGEDLSGTVKDVPMGANTDKADYRTNPDVRVFPLDNVTGEITFTNDGEQVPFVIVLDVVENETVTVGEDGYASYCGKNNIDLTGTDIEAYVARSVDGTQIKMEKVAVVPAKTGVILKSTNGGAANAVVKGQAEAPEVGTNLLTGILKDTEVTADNNFIFGKGDSGIGFYPLTASHTLAAGKAYLHYAAPAGAKGLTMTFGDATGISEVSAAEKTADNVYYNLNGTRVQNPVKGLYILNGKKVVVK